MQYAIELFFDPAMEQAISLLSQSVAEAGLSTKYLEWKTRPHVTLACFNDVDEATCAAKLADFARTHSILPAYLTSVGLVKISFPVQEIVEYPLGE